ncbi:cyclin-dependent kinase inhibitor 3 family protein [Salinivibrio socompensis]|uniref:cyclin-dependent kinase inhibitor 3 family protein n=1 Tax=Salinivibrio socompensis TaxID=1510206 RepID=UPI00046EAE4B|nr:cyclin-dependent kinase inhibitor 3 family protein [Salinivibrio socompensis]
MTHPTWRLPLEKGGLILTPCPGTKQVTLRDSIAQLKTQGVTVVVTALSQDEMHAQGVNDLAAHVEALGLQWFHTPIADDCAPDDAFHARWQHISPSLHQALKRGEDIAMHCLGGSGRTGLLAAHLLLEKGWQLDDIITHVQALRPGAFTKENQLVYIRDIANQ